MHLYSKKKLTLCNNGGHLYLQQKGEGCQSGTDFGLHQIPGIASQNFGNLAFFVTECLGIPRNSLEFPFRESTIILNNYFINNNNAFL